MLSFSFIMESKHVLKGGSSLNIFLESDAKQLSSTVEVDTDQLEKYLGSIQEKLAKYDTVCESFPILSRKLDLCLLDVDVIRQKFYQDMHNQQQVLTKGINICILFMRHASSSRYSPVFNLASAVA